MDICESSQLDPEVELKHWWFRTRCAHLSRAVNSALKEQHSLSLLETGCGTGQNLRFLRQETRFSKQIVRLTGIDVAWTHQTTPMWLGPHDQILQKWEDLQGQYDFMVAMDVLEHTENDYQVLQQWLNHLKPGGWLFITVPAFPFLWSYHDELLGHQRRYTLQSLEAVCKNSGLLTLRLSYAFSHIFFPALFLRVVLPQRPKLTTDLKMPSSWMNWILTQMGRVEMNLGRNSFFGTSVIGFFRKP